MTTSLPRPHCWSRSCATTVRHVETVLGALLSRYPDLAVVGICINDADAYPGDRPHELSGQARVAAWIGDYNITRRHSACGMMSPVACELARGAAREAA